MAHKLHRPVKTGVHGGFVLTLRNAKTGRIDHIERADNLIVTTGLNVLAAALNWAFVQNYNTSWGNPYTTTSGNLADVYGVVGTSSTAAAAGNTALGLEIGRALITNSAVSNNQVTLNYFFPTTVGNGVIAEVGTVVDAQFVTPVTTAAMNSGTAYTSIGISGVTADIPSGSTVTLGYGTGTVATLTTTSDTPIGATTMSFSSFTPSSTFASGSTIAYVPGTLLDRAVLASTVTKLSSQTLTLQLNLTLVST